MKEITVDELKKLQDTKADFQLIDVREKYEFDEYNIGGELISLGDIPHNMNKISKTKTVILHCKSGSRSANVAKWLEKNHDFTNLFSLKGGVVAWKKQIS